MKYSIARKNMPYFKHIIERDGIKAIFEENGQNYVMSSDISRGKFKDILEEALGKRNQDEHHLSTPMYGHRILRNSKVLKKLQHDNGTHHFRIYSRELEKFLGYSI